jgi:hypothetical protein
MPSVMKRLSLIPIAAFVTLALPVSAQASHSCGTVTFKGVTPPLPSLRVSVTKGTASCAEAKKVMHKFFSGHNGPAHCYSRGSACHNGQPTDLANSYVLVYGWRCGTGAGGGNCSQRRNQLDGIFGAQPTVTAPEVQRACAGQNYGTRPAKCGIEEQFSAGQTKAAEQNQRTLTELEKYNPGIQEPTEDEVERWADETPDLGGY